MVLQIISFHRCEVLALHFYWSVLQCFGKLFVPHIFQLLPTSIPRGMFVKFVCDFDLSLFFFLTFTACVIWPSTLMVLFMFFAFLSTEQTSPGKLRSLFQNLRPVAQSFLLPALNSFTCPCTSSSLCLLLLAPTKTFSYRWFTLLSYKPLPVSVKSSIQVRLPACSLSTFNSTLCCFHTISQLIIVSTFNNGSNAFFSTLYPLFNLLH